MANRGCVRYLNPAWPPGLLLSYSVTLCSAEQGLARCAETPGACLILEEMLGLAPSHPHAPQSSQGLQLQGPPWGLIHTSPTVLIQNHTILCLGKIHALSKWTISKRVTQVIHSVLQSFTCKYFIFLLNIFRWLWILDVMRTLLWNAGNTKDSRRGKTSKNKKDITNNKLERAGVKNIGTYHSFFLPCLDIFRNCLEFT